MPAGTLAHFVPRLDATPVASRSKLLHAPQDPVLLLTQVVAAHGRCLADMQAGQRVEAYAAITAAVQPFIKARPGSQTTPSIMQPFHLGPQPFSCRRSRLHVLLRSQTPLVSIAPLHIRAFLHAAPSAACVCPLLGSEAAVAAAVRPFTKLGHQHPRPESMWQQTGSNKLGQGWIPAHRMVAKV